MPTLTLHKRESYFAVWVTMRRFPSSIEGILLRYLAANPTPDGGPRSECNRPSTLVPGPPVTTTAGVAPTEQPLQQCRNMLFDVCRSSDSAEDMERCKEKCRSLRYANGTCLALPPSAQLGAAVCFCAGDLFPSGYIDRQHILGPRPCTQRAGGKGRILRV